MKINTKFSLGDVVKVTLGNTRHNGTVVGVHTDTDQGGSTVASYDVTLPPELRDKKNRDEQQSW